MICMTKSKMSQQIDEWLSNDFLLSKQNVILTICMVKSKMACKGIKSILRKSRLY